MPVFACFIRKINLINSIFRPINKILEEFSMNNFNTNLYETKREIINYSNKITEGLKKPTAKFIMDMLYGLSKNQSVMLSDISRALDENIKLNYTIDRLSKNLEKINDEELEIIRNNYNRAVLNEIDEEPLVLLDDSEIIKKYALFKNFVVF